MPKRKGRGGRLRKTNAGKKPVKVDDKLDILAKQSEMVEVEEVEEGSGFEEEQEAGIVMFSCIPYSPLYFLIFH